MKDEEHEAAMQLLEIAGSLRVQARHTGEQLREILRDLERGITDRTTHLVKTETLFEAASSAISEVLDNPLHAAEAWEEIRPHTVNSPEIQAICDEQGWEYPPDPEETPEGAPVH